MALRSHLHPSPPDALGGLIAAAPHSPFQTPVWAALLKQFFGLDTQWHTWSDSSAPETLIAACPVVVSRSGLTQTHESFPGGSQSVFGGIFARPGYALPDLLAALSLPANATFTATQAPLPTLATLAPAEHTAALAQHTGTIKQTLLIDLAPTEDTLFNTTVDSKRRNMVRKAEKSGLHVHLASTAAKATHLPAFEGWLASTYERAGIKPLPQGFLAAVLDAFNPTNIGGTNATPHTFLATALNAEGAPLSGLFALGNAHMVHYWLGASDYQAKNDGQNDLLQWHAISAAKRAGASWYDLCMYEPERLPSIATFKKGFSRNEVPVFFLKKAPTAAKVLGKLGRLAGR